jgi:hypothetical protein
LSQVGPAAVGRTVACPNCGDHFDAMLVGLALLPVGIPLLWLIARSALQTEPVFSAALPLAVGLGVSGLAVGVGLVRRWSHPARVRAVLVMTVVGYLTAAGLFAVRKEWAAAARKLFGPAQIDFKEWTQPGLPYKAQVPGQRASPATDGPVGGWELRTYTATAGQPDDRRGVWAVRYTLADGKPPIDAKADDDWFAAVREAVVTASGGEVTRETPVRVSGKPARELWLTLPDRLTHRVVRLVRADDKLVYAAAEGLFLAADRDEVTKFLAGLTVK